MQYKEFQLKHKVESEKNKVQYAFFHIISNVVLNAFCCLFNFKCSQKLFTS